MPESSASAKDASRHVGDAELTPRPIAVPNVIKIEDTAEAVSAPNTIGDHCSFQPSSDDLGAVLTSAGVSMTVMASLSAGRTGTG